MPPRPRTPRSRVSTLRRPRVAGRTPVGHRLDGPAATRRVVETRPGGGKERTAVVAVATPAEVPESLVDPAPAEHPAVTGPAEDPTTSLAVTAPTKGPTTAGAKAARAGISGFTLPLLAAALVMLTGLALTFGVLDSELRSTPSASNTALVDVGTTAEAAGQLADALETVYSYDFARLDANERAARAVITPAFAVEFDRLFGQVRELAPEQQAVVTATVTVAAVRSVEGDRVVLVAFMDQLATRAVADGRATQLAAAARLTVTGERVNGQWRIAGVESR